jgi:hypothetical protein
LAEAAGPATYCCGGGALKAFSMYWMAWETGMVKTPAWPCSKLRSQRA